MPIGNTFGNISVANGPRSAERSTLSPLGFPSTSCGTCGVMPSVTPFEPRIRPAPYLSRSQGSGPDVDEPCPCGSAQAAGGCHLNPSTHRWQLPAFAPLLTGERTGLSCDGCYASLTNDCDGKLSNEHWLSKGILVEASDGKVVRIGGLPWQPEGSANELSPGVLGSNVLCERHNNALSPLDGDAVRAFTTLDKFYLDQISHPDLQGNEFDLISGEQLERWLLKMLWGASAAFPTTPQMRASVDREMLADYLFRDAELPADWGLYVKGLQGGRRGDPDLSLTLALENIDGALSGGSMVVGGVEFYFSFSSLTGGGGAVALHRPSVIFLDRDGSSNCKVLALSWDHGTASLAKGVRVSYGERR
jgi:hypothetical protein